MGLREHFCCRCSISKPRPVLDSSSKTKWGVCFKFFEKSQNELRWPFLMFLAILAKWTILR